MDIYSLSQKIHFQIQKANNVLLIAHQNPDADALGSLMAFSQWLKELGKNHTKFCLNQPVDNLNWILNYEPLVTDFKKLVDNNYDLIIILDSGDLKYAGVENILDTIPSPFIINIDHHTTNLNFGHINVVDPLAVSTTEVIYRIFKILRLKIDTKTASALLAGIIGDTYNFTNPNTNYQSLATASELLLVGARLDQVSDSIFKNKTVETLKIWGEILVRLSYNSKLKVVSTVVTKDDLKDNLSLSDVTEGVANFLNNLAGVKAALILQQQGSDLVKGSFRTNDDLIDVSKLAKILGGGGHKKAAGFTINGKLTQTKQGYWQIV